MAGTSLTVATYNLRFASEQDPQPWSRRRGPMIELVRDLRPHVLGTQEGLDHQLGDVLEGLGDRYAMVAEPRGAGRSPEEHSAVLWDTEALELTDVVHRWLSDTPQVPGSRGWGNGFPRMYTVATFRRIDDGAPLTVFCTHLDHESAPARLRSAQALAAQVRAVPGGQPVVVMGDFNVGEGSEPYEALLGAGLRDAWVAATRPGPRLGTFNGYATPDPDGERIDWLLVSDAVTVTEAWMVDVAPGGQYPSDHLPVAAVLELPAGA